jgi:hypothetical protein
LVRCCAMSTSNVRFKFDTTSSASPAFITKVISLLECTPFIFLVLHVGAEYAIPRAMFDSDTPQQRLLHMSQSPCHIWYHQIWYHQTIDAIPNARVSRKVVACMTLLFKLQSQLPPPPP